MIPRQELQRRGICWFFAWSSSWSKHSQSTPGVGPCALLHYFLKRLANLRQVSREHAEFTLGQTQRVHRSGATNRCPASRLLQQRHFAKVLASTDLRNQPL